MSELANIKGRELPFYMLKKLNATPSHTFRIVSETEIEYDDEGNPMPPEEDFRPEFVKEVEKRCKEYENGKFVRCKTKEEQDALF
jgi:hypothetical protein